MVSEYRMGYQVNATVSQQISSALSPPRPPKAINNDGFVMLTFVEI